MPTDFFLIGDSHAAALRTAASELGLSFRGGAVSGGRALNGNFFRIEDNRFVMDDDNAFGGPDRFTDILIHAGPVLSTIGFNTHNFLVMSEKFERRAGCSLLNLSSAVLTQWVRDARAGAFVFYKVMAEHGKRVFFAIPPQIFSTEDEKKVGQYLEEILIREFQALGAEFVDVRPETCGPDGTLRPDLVSKTAGDSPHGSSEWGKIVLAKFIRAANIQ